MYQGFYEIKSNKKLTENIFEMVLIGDTSSITAPGQFINIKLDGFYLRRPISICDYDDSSITIIYKVVAHAVQVVQGKKKETAPVTARSIGQPGNNLYALEPFFLH